MGAVYLAADQRLNGRRCAIKENRPDPAASPKAQAQARDQFLAEASVLARLDHPNLPKVSDYFIENGREYLVMDYVAGDDLESRMTATNRPLPETEVIGWADQVLDALAYLHNQKPQPIIHRDIKPANLRVDLYNRIKLVDFGLVKLFDANSPETKAELRGIGTPAYAPLEQFAGSDEHTDPRSDIYSFGATLYHLLTNVPPVEVHRRLLKPESLPAPRGLNSTLSEHIQTVILRAISIYPDERYQTAEEMRRALLNAGQPPAAKAKKSARSSSPIVFGLIGLLLVIGLLGGIAYLLLNNQNQAVALATPSAQTGGDTPMPRNNAPGVPPATPTAPLLRRH
jgi:serine/threonine-protein kinase